MTNFVVKSYCYRVYCNSMQRLIFFAIRFNCNEKVVIALILSLQQTFFLVMPLRVETDEKLKEVYLDDQTSSRVSKIEFRIYQLSLFTISES